jgi:CRISPR-associated protein Cmr5
MPNRKKNLETYIPLGFEALREMDVVKADQSISKEYKGYLSSFGASIRMSGLLPTLAFYYNAERDETTISRKSILECMWITYCKAKNIGGAEASGNALTYAISRNPRDRKAFEAELLDISVALKLCVRTYKQV